jgi:hypothetical protein
MLLRAAVATRVLCILFLLTPWELSWIDLTDACWKKIWRHKKLTYDNPRPSPR